MIKIGDFRFVSGTTGRDEITGIGGEVVLGGRNRDRLTGYSSISNDGAWRIPSILSGGRARDLYFPQQGSFTIIADAGAGRDAIIAPFMNTNNISFMRINQRDILATDGINYSHNRPARN